MIGNISLLGRRMLSLRPGDGLLVRLWFVAGDLPGVSGELLCQSSVHEEGRRVPSADPEVSLQCTAVHQHRMEAEGTRGSKNRLDM
ncbi:unnamed protein product [Nezara viridula]|uniref:Uncharacterized protein n=1 Tax=Nezara viridula TaxID=85310 RepID=A0A9P0HT42_NEZVI|nr:unnamed protein product [Nezara viridula]